MGKIIIDIRNDISDEDAMSAVLAVVKEGQVSIGAKNKKHYCWLSILHNGIYVSTSPKYNTDTNKFIVHLNKPKS
jgi:hypothetical protein